MSSKNDLAIRWSNHPKALGRLRNLTSIPVYGMPKHFRCPGGTVAVVDGSNRIRLTFSAVSIDGPMKVRLADGQVWPNGYKIRADKRTLRYSMHGAKVPVRGWHAVGAFRYFDAKTLTPTTIGDHTGEPPMVDPDASYEEEVTFRPHCKGIPGVPHGNPEAILVDQYVAWMGDRVRFGHNYLHAAGLFVDLFDRTHWQLIEAKAAVDRKTLRMAIGQLRDYRRYYGLRYPSLAVLLPNRPSGGCLNLLMDNHVAVIWRTPSGGFFTRRWQPPT